MEGPASEGRRRCDGASQAVHPLRQFWASRGIMFRQSQVAEIQEKYKKDFVPKKGKLAKGGGHAAQLAATGQISEEDQAEFVKFMQAKEMIRGNSFVAQATGVVERHPVTADGSVFRGGGASLTFPQR